MAHRRSEKDRRKEEHERREALRRQKDRRLWIGISSLALIVAVAAAMPLVPVATTPISEGPNVGPRPGMFAPEFTTTDVDGRVFDLRSQLGNVVVLDFMGSRCPSCVIEMPHLVQVYETYRSRNFAIISIDIGGSLGTEDPSVARNFLATYGGTWPIALDNQGLSVRYEVGGSLPTLVVIDTRGIVRLHHAGVITVEDLGRTVESYL